MVMLVEEREARQRERLARYSDEEIAATVAEIAVIEKFGMTAFERRLADDIVAEHKRRLAKTDGAT